MEFSCGCSGLKYLNEQKQRIIHYDLKPGNILFHKGSAVQSRICSRLIPRLRWA